MPADAEPKTLSDVLDRIEAAAAGGCVSVGDLLDELGERSITPVLLAISVLLISPLSGIPGVPTVSAALIVLIGAQGLMRRRHLWLPEALMRREIAAARIEKGVAWLRRPCAWIDRNARPRLCALTAGPMRPLAVLVCLLIASSWPLLEILPMVTSLGATAIALIVFGLLTRDGLFALLGYGAVTGLVAVIWWLA